MSEPQVQSSSVEGFQVLPKVSAGEASQPTPTAATEVANPQPRETRQSRRRQAKLERSERRKKCSHIAASYSRFSTGLQREESNESQQRKCHEAAERNAHEIPADLEFSDSATSGTKRKRDGLDAMLAAAKAGKFSTLYIFSLSRLARESVITMPLLKRLVYQNGVRVICGVEGIDTDRNGWEMIASVYAMVHEQYVKDLSAHILRGQEQTALDGYSVGDWCFGYESVEVSQDKESRDESRRRKKSKPRKLYKVRQDHAEWVIKIFHWFAEEGRTISWIVGELNRCNAPKDHRSKTPDWDHPLVISVLSNTKYIGVWPWGEKFNVRDPETGNIRQEYRQEAVCGRWTRLLPNLRIIPDEIFEQAQLRLAANTAKWSRHRNQKGHLWTSPRIVGAGSGLEGFGELGG